MFSQRLLAGNAPGHVDAMLHNAEFNGPHSIVAISDSELLLSDSRNAALRLLDLDSEEVTTVDLDKSEICPKRPRGIIVDMTKPERILLTDFATNIMYSFCNEQLALFAGTGDRGHCDDIRERARFDRAGSIAQARDGALFVADTGNHVIRVLRCGRVSTLAGNPNKHGKADCIDEFMVDRCLFNAPTGLFVMKDGNLLICDSGNDEIRHIHVGTGLVTTVVSGDKCRQKSTVWYENCAFELNAEYKCNSINEEQRRHLNIRVTEEHFRIHGQIGLLKCPEAITEVLDGGYLIGCANGSMWYLDEKMSELTHLREIAGMGRITCIYEHLRCIYVCDYQYSRIYQLKLIVAPNGVRDLSLFNSTSLKANLQSSLIEHPRDAYLRIGKEQGACTLSYSQPFQENKSAMMEHVGANILPSKDVVSSFDYERFMALLELIRSESYELDTHKEIQTRLLSGSKMIYKEQEKNTDKIEPLMGVDDLIHLTQIATALSTKTRPCSDAAFEKCSAVLIGSIINFNKFIFRNQLIDSNLGGIMAALAIAGGIGRLAVGMRMYDGNGLNIFGYSRRHDVFYSQISQLVRLEFTICAAVDVSIKNVIFDVIDPEGQVVHSFDANNFKLARSGGFELAGAELVYEDVDIVLMLYNSTIISKKESNDLDQYEEITETSPSLFELEFEIAGREKGEELALWSELNRKPVSANFIVSDRCNPVVEQSCYVDVGIASKVKFCVL